MRVSWPRGLIAAAVLACFVTPGLHAEMGSFDAFEVPPGLIHLFKKGVTPDPFPWGRVRPEGTCCQLNTDGDARGDGWPDFGTNFVALQGEVTWSWQEPGDSEIAFAQTIPGGWSPIIILTINGFDDKDPKIAFSEATGGTKIVYWSDDGVNQKVMLLERDSPTLPWENPQIVSAQGETARHPTVGIANGKVHVGYEVELAVDKQIIISGRDDIAPPGTPFVPEVIANSQYAGDSELNLDKSPDHQKVWVSWIHDSTQIGYAGLSAGSWQSPQFKTYSTLDELEDIRNEIREEMIQQ